MVRFGLQSLQILLQFFLLIALFGPVSSLASNGGKPNIVLFMADDFGYECLSCNGSKDYRTPQIDKLAAEGIRFEHCYAHPVCTPSRNAIMTGRYNHRNYQLFGYLDPQEVTFANLLREAGYETAIVGKWQLSGDAETVRDFGFDRHCLWNMRPYKVDETGRQLSEPEDARNRYWAPVLFIDGEWKIFGEDTYGPDVCRDFATTFITANKDRPFFLYYPMILTHSPFEPTPDSENREGTDQQNFRDMVAYTDKVVGQVIEHLEDLGLRENTLILFTGDNGTDKDIVTETEWGTVQGGKADMTDAGTRVPLIANWPGNIPGGRVSQELIDFTDFLPTLVEVGGASLPQNRALDGFSFLSHLKGSSEGPRSWVFCHYWGNRGRTPEGAREFARDRRWKLYGDGNLFDIQADPPEKNPVPHESEEAKQVLEKLQAAFATVHSKDE
jgi:arylsulfatase A